MKSRFITRSVILLIFFFIAFGASFAFAAEPSNSEYTCIPVFQVTATQPSILIILDNSGSMNGAAYSFKQYDHTIKYYGYFEPYVKYTYSSNVFVRDTSGSWDGNFLNWAVMRRIDVARKVLMGGLATSRTGGGNQVNIGEASSSGWDYAVNNGQSDTWGTTPYPNEEFKIEMTNGTFKFYHRSGFLWSSGTTYVIKVQKDISFTDEERNFVDGNLAGVFQKIGDKAEWGLEFFLEGTGFNKSGGYIQNDIDDGNVTNMITNIQNKAADTWTPLAEAYYVAMTYFQQGTLATGLDYKSGSEDGKDPWEDGEGSAVVKIPCAKGFVILITDGASTQDKMIPSAYKNYADSYDSWEFATFMASNSFSDSGSDYLKDLALYARMNDLRADLDGDQNMILYPIFAFADMTTTDGQMAEALLMEAAKNGGYIEKDTVPGPTSKEEWDVDGDDFPDTYYRADNGYELEAKLLKAINAILERAASGTAVSVLSTSGEGDGTITQAFFRPTITDGYYDIQWTGYLQTNWIDSHGNMREDTVADKILNPAEDNIVVHYFDSATNEAKVKRYYVNASDPYPEIDETTPEDETLSLEEVKGLWEAGAMLSKRDPATRMIFTFIDEDNDGTDEMVKFDTTDAALINAITPYLGVRDTTTWNYLNSSAITTETDRATNLINYVRGTDMSGLRRRTMDFDGDGTMETWKLGDIVNSTPVTVGLPSENYHHLYSDQSYLEFYNAMKNRETIVYVGGNDGMLHAFTSGIYDSSKRQFTQKVSTTENIGDELWSYIPKNLLPHLKWLPSENYTHVYYMDLEPRVFSAKIFPDSDGDGEEEWGTVLVAGFNLGGGNISVQADFNGDGDDTDTSDIQTFKPSYVAIDVTDPRNPNVMWEKNYDDLQMTTSIPYVVKVQDEWFLTFGSGPEDCDCTDTLKNSGHVYVVDLKTGKPHTSGASDWLFETSETRAFMASPAALDKNLNFSVDSIYIGESYFTAAGGLAGMMYKLSIPYNGDMDSYGSDTTQYDTAPTNWLFHPIFSIDAPVTVEPTMSIGENDNIWVYFGTGRYLNSTDKTDTSNQYMVGFKDPFFNREHGGTGTFYHDDLYMNYTNSASKTLTLSDLLNSDNYTVYTGGYGKVEGGLLVGTANYFDDLKDLVYEHDTGAYASIGHDGWYKTVSGGERIVVNSTVFAGTVFAPTFLPDADVCGFGGTSSLFGLYYETGTKFYEPIFETDVEKISLGMGKGSEIEIQWDPGENDKTIRTFTQKSTGQIDVRTVQTILGFRSGLIFWNEK